MTPGLAFFYGGLVGRKNVLSTIMQSFIIIAIISVQWVLWGYSLAFGPDKGHVIGGLEWVGLRSVGAEPNTFYGATVPHQAFMIFQLMFAIITPALISGAFAERMKFSTFLVFTLLWATLVYDPLAHWVWADGGWLKKFGALDFAGGTVVHINSGLAALAAAIVLKPRLGYGREPKEPHNIPFVVLGASLLWFGWFGFNAGSAISAGALATSAFVVTNTATAAAALSWMTMAWWLGGAPSLVGAASGAVAGLVAITPASGFVGPMPAIIIGLGAGIFCYLAARVRAGWKSVDDALDVWAVHGVGGTWGALATGIFAAAAIGGVAGLTEGNGIQVAKQLVAVGASWVWSFGMTLIILLVLDRVMGLRVKPEQEEVGLDVTLHGEAAYHQ
ncbi:MAG: ammonium transporter [Chloroflexi bacterium]|nr:ammonium transporter [Chloroflexota bacterium]